MKTIILTGFEPFGGETTNPAYEAVKLVPEIILDTKIIKLEIPVVFNKGVDKIVDELEKLGKTGKNEVMAVLSVGQAGNRSCMTIEKIGINLAEARIPDNEGNQPLDTPIKEDGETAYFTTLPIKAMVENMKKNNIPAHLSYTAGTYVCNDVLYQMLYQTSKNYKDIRAGFIHVPFSEMQVLDKANGTPFMSIEMIAKGLEYGIEAIINNNEDISIAGGETH